MIEPPGEYGGSFFVSSFSCSDLVRSPTERAESQIRSETNTISIPGAETWDCEKSVVSSSIAKFAHILAPLLMPKGSVSVLLGTARVVKFSPVSSKPH
jgi:hypothetical protein